MKKISIYSNLKSNIKYLSFGVPKVLKELNIIEKETESIENTILRNTAIDSLYSVREDCLCYSFFETFPYVNKDSCARFISSLLVLTAYLKELCSRKDLFGTECTVFLYNSFLDSLVTVRQPSNYYTKCPYKNDGGYLLFLVKRCREALRDLPYIGVVKPSIEEYAYKYFSFHVNIFTSNLNVTDSIMAWGESKNDKTGLLTCMEYSAACSNLSLIMALFATGFDPYAGIDTVKDLNYLYFPCVNSLYSLLDSYIDLQPENENKSIRINFCSRYTNQKICESRIIFLYRVIFESLSIMANSSYHKTFIKLFISRFLTDYKAYMGINNITTRNILLSIKKREKSLNNFYKVVKTIGAVSAG